MKTNGQIRYRSTLWDMNRLVLRHVLSQHTLFIEEEDGEGSVEHASGLRGTLKAVRGFLTSVPNDTIPLVD